MVRQSNGTTRISSQRGRGGFRGRGRGGAMFFGRGGVQKPPPLMARPMPPPLGMRRPPLRPCPMGPPPLRMDFCGINSRLMRMPGPGIPRGRGAPGFLQRGRGMRPPFGRGAVFPSGRGSLLPPPPMHGPLMFRPRLPLCPPLGPPGVIRGRGIPRGRGAPANVGNRKKSIRGKGPKKVNMAPSPTAGELNKPWVTEAMKNEILKKHKLHQKAKKARTKEDWDIFKEHRNKVTTMLREAKIEYIGAHPEEDVDKILAEASSSGSNNDESKEATTSCEGNNTAPILEEGAEPMEDEGGVTSEGMDILLKCDDGADDDQPPQDPEVEMNSETNPEAEQKGFLHMGCLLAKLADTSLVQYPG